MKLSDVLWDAANKHLDHISDGVDGPGRKRLIFSCNAISRAIYGNLGDAPEWFPLPFNVFNLLKECGVDPYSARMLDRHAEARRQSIRYMWLLIAMHVAEDEGIEV